MKDRTAQCILCSMIGHVAKMETYAGNLAHRDCAARARASGAVVVSQNETDRIAQVCTLLRKDLQNWTARFVEGVAFSDGMTRAVARVFVDHAAMMLVASALAAKDEPDEQTVERALAAAGDAFDALMREVVS